MSQSSKNLTLVLVTSRRKDRTLSLVKFMLEYGLTDFTSVSHVHETAVSLRKTLEIHENIPFIALYSHGEFVHAHTNPHTIDLPQMMWGERPHPLPVCLRCKTAKQLVDERWVCTECK